MTQDEAFKAWWYSEGSQAPYTHHDCEEHTMRMCEIAWANGAYKERETLAQTQEPVAWLEPEWGEEICPEVGFEATTTSDHPRDLCWIPLYPHPPQRTWVNLTVDELIDLEHKHLRHEDLARAIEAKLKELNT